MLLQEFTTRTGYTPTMAEFDTIHNEYMSTNMDKNTWCKVWRREHLDTIRRQQREMAESEHMEHVLRHVTFYATERVTWGFKEIGAHLIDVYLDKQGEQRLWDGVARLQHTGERVEVMAPHGFVVAAVYN